MKEKIISALNYGCLWEALVLGEKAFICLRVSIKLSQCALHYGLVSSCAQFLIIYL